MCRAIAAARHAPPVTTLVPTRGRRASHRRSATSARKPSRRGKPSRNQRRSFAIVVATTVSRAHALTTLQAYWLSAQVHEESSKEAAMEVCIAQHAPAAPARTHTGQIEREAA